MNVSERLRGMPAARLLCRAGGVTPWRLARLLLALSLALSFMSPGRGQDNLASQPLPQPGRVRLNLQGETRLSTLIDYVSQRLELQFLYSPDLVDKTVHVRAPRDIPISSLLPLLSSVLRMENLVLIEAAVPGFKRIVDVRELPKHARPGEAQQVLDEHGAAAPVTQAFVLEYITASQVATLIRPLLTQGQGVGAPNIIPLADTNVLVVTDYAPTVLTVEKLIRLIDRPPGQVEFEFYEVQHLDANGLAEQVKTLISRGTSRPSAPSPAAPRTDRLSVNLIPNQRTNQVVVVGPRLLVAEALALLKRFDVSLGLMTEVYRLEYVQSERFDRLVKGFFAERDIARLYSSTVDEEGNMLIVRATSEIHERIAELREQIDVPVEASDSPIRFYKLKNANAADVLFTLRSLQELTSLSNPGLANAGNLILGTGQSTGAVLFPGNTMGGLQPLAPAAQLPGTLNNVPRPQSSIRAQGNTNQPLQLPLEPDAGPLGAYEQTQQARSQRLSDLSGLGGSQQLFGGALGGVATLPGGARVSADFATNSLVVYAPPDIQQMYAKLIESLDRRRPQVLIEAEIVAIDTTDTVRIGVEASTGDRTGANRLFEFTSFGLSEVNPATGALTIRPALGFNGTMINSDVADVVVQALASHTHAEVLAAPRILVNDNVPGQLESVVSIPFQSVNASQTVSTTSLGGNSEAGTIITVTPHINEDEHLLLEFAVEFSTFTGNAAPNLPPPRQIDRIESTVTIPDGQTVIVGGLRRIRDAKTATGIPFVEKVPVLRELTSLNTSQQNVTSFFLFIRPIIMRDDRFADLRFVSDKALRDQQRPGQYPSSQPLLIE